MGHGLIPCRVCGNEQLTPFLDLGTTPLANRFLPREGVTDERRYPLQVCLCPRCSLVTLGHVVPPETMFQDYIYVTGTSDTMPRHFAELARTVSERFLSGKPAPLVVEAGSNDGTLLRAFAADVRTLGVEPATNIAELARGRGVETWNDFFTEATARRIRDTPGKGEAALLLGNNVFAHVPDVHDFVRGARALLAADGVFVFEVPYLFDMLDHVEFDTIYHEHLSYFSLTALTALFDRHELQIFDVAHQDIHGGTVRVFVQRVQGGVHPIAAEVPRLLAEEARRGLSEPAVYQQFARRVYGLRDELVGMLRRLRQGGSRIVGYGSPAKGNTLLNFMDIGRDLLDYLVDKNPMKQGLFTPGKQLPVLPVERLLADRPDYALILAWNFADEIMRQQQAYHQAGGRFIIPLPSPRLV
jgi:SAM-dependent methyltransferase